MVHLEDHSRLGHGGDPVGARIEASTEDDHLLHPRAEGLFGRVVDEAGAGDG